MSVRIEAHADGAVIRVRAAPGASRERLVGVHGDALKIAVSAPPEKGKANARLLLVLAGALGVPARTLRLVAGETSRDKMVLVSGFTVTALRDRLGALLDSEP